MLGKCQPLSPTNPVVCLISSGNRQCPWQAAGLLPFRPDTFSPCSAPSLWRKIPSSFVSKSALFRASRALADSEGRWDPCPVPSPGPELCQEGTQVSGGGREPRLPSLSTMAVSDKGLPGECGPWNERQAS